MLTLFFQQDQDYAPHSTYGPTLPPSGAAGFPLAQSNGLGQPQNLSQTPTSVSHSNGYPFASPNNNVPSSKDGELTISIFLV